MTSNNDSYIIIRNPNNPNQHVRAKLLRHQKIRGEDHEYELEDGTRIRLILDVDNISRPIDPETNRPAINPTTGEPVINISWGFRVMTVYSERALREFGGSNR